MNFSSAALVKAFGGLAVASTVVTVGVVKKDSIAVALGLNLDKSIFKDFLPGCENSGGSTCSLNKTQLGQIKLISKNGEKWETITVEEAEDTKNVVDVSWEKAQQSNNDFPLGWVFTIKSSTANKTIKIKKGTKEISIDNTGTKFWLTQKQEQNVKKYYLSEELIKADEEANKKLIDYIKTDNNDIEFKVLKEDSGTDDLNSDYLTFSSSPKTAVIRVTLDTNGNDQFKGTQGTTITDLKKLNHGDVWTWECKIKLTPEGDINGATQLAEEGKLWKGTGSTNGLFDILKENSTDSSKSGQKNTKIKFIENCASKEGNTSSPKRINENKLIFEHEFKIKKGGDGGTSANKLIFIDTNKFNRWFGTTAAA